MSLIWNLLSGASRTEPRNGIGYLSVCSGIEAATAAWHDLGTRPVAFSEIEKFPCAVLAHHHPGVPNLGDMTRWREWPEDLLAEADVLVGGTPCQAFSVAGLRNSLSDERGNLTLIYAQLLNHIDSIRGSRGLRPAVCVWENVPGVLSTKDNAFGCFLAALAGEDEPLLPSGKIWTNAGYVLGPERAVAWRVLDAQYFGLAQRRRRVFVVACSGDGPDPREVLFEREGVRRDSPPGREARESVTPTVRAGAPNGGAGHGAGSGGSKDELIVPVHTSGGLIPEAAGQVTPIVPVGADCYNGTVTGQVAATLGTQSGDGVSSGPSVLMSTAVRRLTPTECERLQGFPDNHTRIPWRGKPASECPDGPRYKAIGNSMAVPCMKWIGKRLFRHLQ